MKNLKHWEQEISEKFLFKGKGPETAKPSLDTKEELSRLKNSLDNDPLGLDISNKFKLPEVSQKVQEMVDSVETHKNPETKNPSEKIVEPTERKVATENVEGPDTLTKQVLSGEINFDEYWDEITKEAAQKFGPKSVLIGPQYVNTLP